MSTRKAFFLGGLAVFLVLVLAFVLIGVFVPSSEDEIASVGEIPTTVPVPTAMPRMTLNPTATIAPIPTATTVPCPTDEESGYIEGVRSGMSSYGTQLTMFGEELVAASSKPWLFLDDDWQIHRETQIDVMVRTVERVEALQAPASASHIADQVDNLALDMRTGLSMIRMSLQNIDADELEAGTARLIGSTPSMILLGYDLDTFCE